jgi:hypothetical protein
VEDAPERNRSDRAIWDLEPLRQPNCQPADVRGMVSGRPAQNAHESRPQPRRLSKGELGDLAGGKRDLKPFDSLT